MTDGVDRRFAAARDRRGRFLKGASGNPLGRPPGIMNQATRDAAVLLGGEAGALTRKAIELALAGDIAALRLCIDRIIAPQREQPVAFAMPPIGTAGDLAAAATALTVAAAAGAMTPGDAASLAQVLEAHARISEVTDRVVPLTMKKITTMSHRGRYLYSHGKLKEWSPWYNHRLTHAPEL